jgi:hypothetical protein
MSRRELVGGLSGAAAAGPLIARAQQAQPMRHIGVLTPLAEGDPVGRACIAAFQEGLRELGGSTATTYGSSIAGPEAIRLRLAITRHSDSQCPKLCSRRPTR